MDKTRPAVLLIALATVALCAPSAGAMALQFGEGFDAATRADAGVDARAAADAHAGSSGVLATAADATAPDLPTPAALDVRVDATADGVSVEARVAADVAPIERTSVFDASTDQAAAAASGGFVPPAAAEAAPAAVATVGLLALLQASGAFRWLTMAGVALYSRLAKSDLLDNEHRDRVYKFVQENPGMGLTELMERAGLGWGTTVYHLDRLERAGFVTSERAGLHRCYFPVGTVSKDARKGLGALKAETTRSIAQFLVARPGVTQGELCDSLGLSASAASKQITKLERAGLVRRERDWKTVHLHPAATLPQLLGGENPETPPAHTSVPVAA